MMMRGFSGAVAVLVAAVLVCCHADSHQDQDVGGNDHISGDRYDGGGHKTRNLDPLGGGNLVRQVRESRHAGWVPYMVARRYDYGSPYSAKRELWPVEFGGYYGDGLPKRNFDEIDRSGLDNFVKKRNFDEIDQTSMPFPYAIKRVMHFIDPNYIQHGGSRYEDRRPGPQMDEIDITKLPIG